MRNWMRRSVFVLALLLASLSLPGTAGSQLVRQQALDAFLEAAFTMEYGEGGRDFLLRWDKPIRLSVEGQYQPEEELVLDAFLEALNALPDAHGAAAFPGISRAGPGQRADLRIIYCPYEEMGEHLAFYQPDNWGFFEYYYEDYRITRATIAIAADVTNYGQRIHLLLEELTGALGLTNDIGSHPDSIIHQSWTETQELSELDWLMLSFLYSPLTQPGMSAAEACDSLLPTL